MHCLKHFNDMDSREKNMQDRDSLIFAVRLTEQNREVAPLGDFSSLNLESGNQLPSPRFVPYSLASGSVV